MMPASPWRERRNVARLERREQGACQPSSPGRPGSRNVARLGRREQEVLVIANGKGGVGPQCGSPSKTRANRPPHAEARPASRLDVARLRRREQGPSPHLRSTGCRAAMWFAFRGESKVDLHCGFAGRDPASMWLASGSESKHARRPEPHGVDAAAMWLALGGESKGSAGEGALSCGDLSCCEQRAFDPSRGTTIYESRSEKLGVRCLRAGRG
jgi:hypothetical protein